MSKWSEYKERNGVTILDIFNRTPASEEVAESRISTCNACPELIPITHQCKKCGCFMALKTKMQAAKCPLGKW
jgi:hypothetical protein